MNEKYMKIALKEAIKSYKKGEVPIGCVIVYKNKIIAKTHNLKEKKKNSLCHAELIAINKATKKIKNWRLDDCNIYVTMQPCPMCASAIKQSRISNVYYGVSNENNNLSNMIFEEKNNNKKVNVYDGILEKECKKIVQEFFNKQRKITKK